MSYELPPINPQPELVDTAHEPAPDPLDKWSVLGGLRNRTPNRAIFEDPRFASKDPATYPIKFFLTAQLALETVGLLIPAQEVDQELERLNQLSGQNLSAKEARKLARDLTKFERAAVILEVATERLQSAAYLADRYRREPVAQQELRRLTVEFERPTDASEDTPEERPAGPEVPVFETLTKLRNKPFIGPITAWGSRDTIRIMIAVEKGIPLPPLEPHLSSVE